MADALTADLPKGAAVRPGAIVLARHGEPDIHRKVMLNAHGYRDYWSRYEQLGIRPGQKPPLALVEQTARAGVIISSVRNRSIESALALAAGREFARNALFVEAPLPPPHWPSFVRMSPKVWGFIARFWWWFFNHHEGQETRREAEARAEQAADMIVEYAGQGHDVVVLAHGFFNFMVGRALRRRGWRLTANQGWKYWSTRRYERR
ncbi:histidine phosphatase family protein [Phenylobacterium sp.]|jgi:broad specificity phosphatase PhoE|uniref:histidine phosphatase family protein n=1 Tax=Phenylobacterium sp. TaxID=1871053 RepID=UPI0035B167A1